MNLKVWNCWGGLRPQRQSSSKVSKSCHQRAPEVCKRKPEAVTDKTKKRAMRHKKNSNFGQKATNCYGLMENHGSFFIWLIIYILKFKIINQRSIILPSKLFTCLKIYQNFLTAIRTFHRVLNNQNSQNLIEWSCRKHKKK